MGADVAHYQSEHIQFLRGSILSKLQGLLACSWYRRRRLIDVRGFTMRKKLPQKVVRTQAHVGSAFFASKNEGLIFLSIRNMYFNVRCPSHHPFLFMVLRNVEDHQPNTSRNKGSQGLQLLCASGDLRLGF